MLFQASAGKLRESGQEVWPDITFGQLELVTVLHLHQIQTERVGRHPASAANAALQYLTRPFDRALAGTDGHQHPGNVAHHVMQEGASTDIDDNHLAVPGHPQMMYLLDR